MKKFIGLFYGRELNGYGVKKIDSLTNTQEEKIKNRIANKFLSNLKYGSRNDIKKMCKNNLIKVNGSLIKKSDFDIDPETDIIEQNLLAVTFVNILKINHKNPIFLSCS